MSKFLPAPNRAIQKAWGGAREVLHQSQKHLHGGTEAIASDLPEMQRPVPMPHNATSTAEHDLCHCAWNGSIGDGILQKIHWERRDAVTATRTANAIQFSALSNRLAALEAELSVLVEPPPKAAPTSTVLKIGPSRKGA